MLSESLTIIASVNFPGRPGRFLIEDFLMKFVEVSVIFGCPFIGKVLYLLQSHLTPCGKNYAATAGLGLSHIGRPA